MGNKPLSYWEGEDMGPLEGEWDKYCCCCLVAKSCLTLVRPHEPYPAKLLCPWDFPGKNTGVCCHFLLQSIAVTECKFMYQYTVKLNKPKHQSLEQRKVYSRAKQGELVTNAQNTQIPQWFWGRKYSKFEVTDHTVWLSFDWLAVR